MRPSRVEPARDGRELGHAVGAARSRACRGGGTRRNSISSSRLDPARGGDVRATVSAPAGRTSGPRRRTPRAARTRRSGRPASSSFQWRMSEKRRLGPAPRRAEISFGNIATPTGHRRPAQLRGEVVEALPVEPGRRRAGAGEPVEHHVVEQLVAGEDVLGVAVAVGPGPELLDDPRGLAGGGVDEPVPERLRPGRLLGRVAGLLPLVVRERRRCAASSRCGRLAHRRVGERDRPC